MPSIGGPELLIVLAVFVLLFGAKKLPELGSSVGKSIKNFKRGLDEAHAEKDENAEADENADDKADDKQMNSTS
jgi:sec-independent protein translocase protein TatA